LVQSYYLVTCDRDIKPFNLETRTDEEKEIRKRKSAKE